MKKTTIISIALIILTLSFPVTSSQGYEVGETYEYVVNEASGEFNYINEEASTVSGQTDDFRVGDTSVPEDSLLNVTITDVRSDAVDFKILDDTGTELTTVTSTDFGFALSLIVYSLYPFVSMGFTEESVTPVDPSLGVSIGDIWFMAPPGINWDNVYDTYNDSQQWQDMYEGFEGNEANLTAGSSANKYDGNDTIAFTVTSIGQYMNTTEDTDLFIYHRMRFDYSVSEYNLLGYRMNSNINGTYEGTESDFHMLLEVKLSTYTRRLGPTNIFIGITALFIFGTFVIIKKRRK